MYINTRKKGIKKRERERERSFPLKRVGNKKVLPEHQKILFPCVSGQALTQVVQGGFISLPRLFKSCVHMLGQGKWTRWPLPFIDSLIL